MSKHFLCGAAAFAIAAGLAAAPSDAQVIINEVFENPPGGIGDDVWEYIEFYGRPGTDLTGYAIGLAKGGQDSNDDDIPDGDDEIVPEFDEVFTLDGCEIGPNGFFVLFNTSFGTSLVDDVLMPNPDFDPMAEETNFNRPFLNGVAFQTAHIPSSDTSGKLSNDNSSTYLLVRKRPNHMIDDNGMSVYMSGYAFRKEPNPDVDFDGKLDFGVETPAPGVGGAAFEVEPLQIVDEVAWSNNGGKEYVMNSEQEISETPGFNPDAISRINYFLENPMIGHRSRDLSRRRLRDPPHTHRRRGVDHGRGRLTLRRRRTRILHGHRFRRIRPVPHTHRSQRHALQRHLRPRTRRSSEQPLLLPRIPTGSISSSQASISKASSSPPPPSTISTAPHEASTPSRSSASRGAISISTGPSTRTISPSSKTAPAQRSTTPRPPPSTTIPPTILPTTSSSSATSGRDAPFQQTLMMLEMDMADATDGGNALFITNDDIQAVRDLVPVVVCAGDCNDDGQVNFGDLTGILFAFGQPGTAPPKPATRTTTARSTSTT